MASVDHDGISLLDDPKKPPHFEYGQSVYTPTGHKGRITEFDDDGMVRVSLAGGHFRWCWPENLISA